MSKPPTSVCSIPRECREELADTIEDIGQAMSLLREAVTDEEEENICGGKLSASDALEIISNLESRFSEIAAKLATWSEA